MADSPADVVNKELHPQAVELIKRYSGGFAESLILQAKILADQRQHDMVLRSHVEEAFTLLRRGEQQQWREPLANALGGVFLGAFVSGLPTELSAVTPRASWILVYVLMGFLGLSLIFWGLRRS